MTQLDPNSLDLPMLAALAGLSTTEHLLRRMQAAGHPEIRNSHGYVFQCLIAGPRSVGEIAEQLGFTQQAASKVVLELEGLGYVERRADAQDSRVRQVALTAKGRHVIERGRAARAALEAELIAELGSRTVASARRALTALLEHTGGLEAVAGRRVKLPSR